MTIYRLDDIWPVWLQMRGMDWHFLPYGGGLLEQPGWMMEGIIKLETMYQRIKQELSPDAGN